MVTMTSAKAWLCCLLLAWAFIECCLNESQREIWQDPNYALFMVMGDLLLLLWMWGVSLQVWRSSRISWASLLGLEVTKLASLEVPEVAVYDSALEMSSVYLACFAVFNMVNRGVFFSSEPFIRTGEGGEQTRRIPIRGFHISHVLPVLLVIFFVYRAVTPWAHRKIWWYHLRAVVIAPLCAVTFRCGYIGDLLTSLVRVLVQAAYALCYLLLIPYAMLMHSGVHSSSNISEELGAYEYLCSGKWWHESTLLQRGLVPWLTLLPLWIRLMQCLRRSVESGKRWPHIANAFKYTSAIVVISIGTIVPSVRHGKGVFSWLWILAFVGATCFQFMWDVTMDWGLLVPANSEHADNSVALAAALSVQLGQHDVVAGQVAPRRGAVRRLLQWAFGGYALRRKRLLGPLWVYLTVILGNFVLRFAWTLTLLQANNRTAGYTSYGFSLLMAYLTPLIAAAEVFRRMVWGFLRLEWEQLEQQRANKLDVQEPMLNDADSETSGAPPSSTGTTERHAAVRLVESQKQHQNSEDAEDDLEGPLQPMGTAGSAHPRNSTLLYAAADPDGRFHIIGPVIHQLRMLAALFLDAVSCVLERVIFAVGRVCSGVCGPSSDVERERGTDHGYYLRLFEDATWCIYPVPLSQVQALAKKYGSKFGLQIPDKMRYSHQHSALDVDTKDISSAEVTVPLADARIEEGSDGQQAETEARALYERQSLLLAEAAAFAITMLVFLLSVTVMSEVS